MTEILSSPAFIFITLCLAMIGLLIATIVEHFQLVLKYYGGVRGKVASGYSQAMKIMLINRLGAVMFLLFMGLTIDTGIGPKAVTLAFATSFVLLTIFSFCFALWFKRIETDRIVQKQSYAAIRYAWISGVAGAFNLLGFAVPLILASVFPDYRLTLSNLSFIFNSVFTLLAVFFIESKMAELIDENSDELGLFAWRIIAARAPAYAIICAALLLSLLWMPA